MWLGYQILVCVPWVGVLILLCVSIGRVGKCFGYHTVASCVAISYGRISSALWSDNHCLEGFEVRSRGLVTLNL